MIEISDDCKAAHLVLNIKAPTAIKVCIFKPREKQDNILKWVGDGLRHL